MFIAFISIGVSISEYDPDCRSNLILSLPRGIDPIQAGVIGAVFVAAGVVGAIILPIISDIMHIRVPFLISAIIALVPLYLGFTYISGFLMLVIIAGIDAGFAIMGAAPILFQHGSEVAYPTQEGTSLGMILLMGQISGVLFVFLFEALAAGFHSVIPPMLVIVALTASEIPFAFKMKESQLLKRG